MLIVRRRVLAPNHPIFHISVAQMSSAQTAAQNLRCPIGGAQTARRRQNVPDPEIRPFCIPVLQLLLCGCYPIMTLSKLTTCRSSKRAVSILWSIITRNVLKRMKSKFSDFYDCNTTTYKQTVNSLIYVVTQVDYNKVSYRQTVNTLIY